MTLLVRMNVLNLMFWFFSQDCAEVIVSRLLPVTISTSLNSISLSTLLANCSSVGGMLCHSNQASSRMRKNSSLLIFAVSQAFQWLNDETSNWVEYLLLILLQQASMVFARTPSKSTATRGNHNRSRRVKFHSARSSPDDLSRSNRNRNAPGSIDMSFAA